MNAKQLKKSLLLGLAFLPARAVVAQSVEPELTGNVQWTAGLSTLPWAGDSLFAKGASAQQLGELIFSPYIKGQWTLPRGHEFSGQIYSLPQAPSSNLRSAFVFDAEGHWVVGRNVAGGKKTHLGLSYTTKDLVSNKARMGIRRTREVVPARGAGRRGMGVYLTRATNVSRNLSYGPGVGLDVEYVFSGQRRSAANGSGLGSQGMGSQGLVAQGLNSVARLVTSGESVVKGGVSATRLIDPLSGEAFRWYYLSVEVGLGTTCGPRRKVPHADLYQ